MDGARNVMAVKLVRNLIKRTRRASLWNRALDADRSGRISESIVLIKRMEEIAPLNHYHIAFLATSYVLSRDSLKARNLFQIAKAMTDGSECPSARYVNSYVRIYLKMMDTDAPVNDLIDKALLIKCRPSLKRWLPLDGAKKPLT